jgi:hypothetical protein
MCVSHRVRASDAAQIAKAGRFVARIALNSFFRSSGLGHHASALTPARETVRSYVLQFCSLSPILALLSPLLQFPLPRPTETPRSPLDVRLCQLRCHEQIQLETYGEQLALLWIQYLDVTKVGVFLPRPSPRALINPSRRLYQSPAPVQKKTAGIVLWAACTVGSSCLRGLTA